MGAEDDYFSRMVNNTSNDRPGRKPSLQSRLQNGNNLQICFMNEASSDTESISSDSETCPKLSKSTSNASSRYSSMSSISTSNPYNSRPLSVNITNNNNNNLTTITTTTNNNNSRRTLSQRPSTLSLGPPISEENSESDFFTKQARLQIEARMALAQAKDMAHMQMEIERQKQKESPITEVIRNAMEKVGVNFPIEKRRVSRQMCTDMNIAQLQIIVNDLHTQIERLNDNLVQYLMERDELHMSQDSMLVDIEDLTRYLSAKEQTILNEKSDRKNSTELEKQQQQLSNNNSNGIKNNHDTPQMQSKFQRIASLVKK
ncbi:schwannomin-interacting protein 1 [Condylostylus longicornis]|uniref:schwannomin-interacting protein 1 n=1 Tax=Condylostylus longicornis TaxID=2530218 RepID=UPI00244E3D6E|nr:schwannomin-interacting protein 1 [Condylostylus longicornis]